MTEPSDVYAPPAVSARPLGPEEPTARPASVGTRLPRLLVALWCFVAAGFSGFAGAVMITGSLWNVRDLWSVPFTIGMAGASFASVYGAFSRDARRGDRLFWASLTLSALAVTLYDVSW